MQMVASAEVEAPGIDRRSREGQSPAAYRSQRMSDFSSTMRNQQTGGKNTLWEPSPINKCSRKKNERSQITSFEIRTNRSGHLVAAKQVFNVSHDPILATSVSCKTTLTFPLISLAQNSANILKLVWFLN